jgi:hypothetical protein
MLDAAAQPVEMQVQTPAVQVLPTAQNVPVPQAPPQLFV